MHILGQLLALVRPFGNTCDTIKFMSLRTKNKSIVEEVPYGMWVWIRASDNQVAADADGNVMNVFCMDKNTPGAVKALTDAANVLGFAPGKAVWWSGKRPISDEEYEHQVARGRAGLVPDPMDIGAIQDQEREL